MASLKKRLAYYDEKKRSNCVIPNHFRKRSKTSEVRGEEKK